LLAEQPASQPPQCALLVERFSSQPLAAFASQSPLPVWHTQAPLTHCMPVRAAQSVPPGSQPEPMALQVAARAPSQPNWFGVQIRARQLSAASSQNWAAEQACTTVEVSPLALHCRTALFWQKRADGTQASDWHARSKQI
jgi:hypothetical protein